MPKATYSAPSGAIIIVEGTQDEVASVLQLLEEHAKPSVHPVIEKPMPRQQGRITPMGLLANLTSSGFFNKPKELGAVRLALEEAGHFYPTTTLSPLMLRLVRRRELRRIKEKNRWLYVK